MILSTCNRVEVALAFEDRAGGQAIDQFLADYSKSGARLGAPLFVSTLKIATRFSICSEWLPVSIPWSWASRRSWGN